MQTHSINMPMDKHLSAHLKEEGKFLALLLKKHIFELVSDHERHDQVWKIFFL